MLRLVLLLGLNVGSIAQELCLDDGVPFSQRKYIQDDASNNIPIQALECAWASSALLNELTVMLIREVLGFHADIAPQVGASGASPIYALAGCVDFDHATEKNCGSQETQIHVSVDSWVGSYASAQNNFAKEYPRIAAEDLGSMGYSGEESMYVSQEILHAAYSESGLALDFYKSYFAEGSRIAGIADCYNTTHHDPKRLGC
ncbi:Ephrin_rec_like domain-containing protein [Durusdinium trenchii]|uniref:Ephrin_rec_like domain-containing protein n=1 Tax=Durusdinium trenchii TaxID=1381693 RepID=A0ABP0MUH5_9DINO